LKDPAQTALLSYASYPKLLGLGITGPSYRG
jgi:hypothetical protein